MITLTAPRSGASHYILVAAVVIVVLGFATSTEASSLKRRGGRYKGGVRAFEHSRGRGSQTDEGVNDVQTGRVRTLEKSRGRVSRTDEGVNDVRTGRVRTLDRSRGRVSRTQEGSGNVRTGRVRTSEQNRRRGSRTDEGAADVQTNRVKAPEQSRGRGSRTEKGADDGRTGVVVAFETPDQEQFQYGRPGEAVFGAFSWVSPEGVQVVMRYVADAAGYRVVGGPVPQDSRGVAAGGKQVFPRAADGSIILT